MFIEENGAVRLAPIEKPVEYNPRKILSEFVTAFCNSDPDILMATNEILEQEAFFSPITEEHSIGNFRKTTQVEELCVVFDYFSKHVEMSMGIEPPLPCDTTEEQMYSNHRTPANHHGRRKVKPPEKSVITLITKFPSCEYDRITLSRKVVEATSNTVYKLTIAQYEKDSASREVSVGFKKHRRESGMNSVFIFDEAGRPQLYVTVSD